MCVCVCVCVLVHASMRTCHACNWLKRRILAFTCARLLLFSRVETESNLITNFIIFKSTVVLF